MRHDVTAGDTNTEALLTEAQPFFNSDGRNAGENSGALTQVYSINGPHPGPLRTSNPRSAHCARINTGHPSPERVLLGWGPWETTTRVRCSWQPNESRRPCNRCFEHIVQMYCIKMVYSQPKVLFSFLDGSCLIPGIKSRCVILNYFIDKNNIAGKKQSLKYNPSRSDQRLQHGTWKIDPQVLVQETSAKKTFFGHAPQVSLTKFYLVVNFVFMNINPHLQATALQSIPPTLYLCLSLHISLFLALCLSLSLSLSLYVCMYVSRIHLRRIREKHA